MIYSFLKVWLDVLLGRVKKRGLIRKIIMCSKAYFEGL
jgi:hypothetical protein